MKKLICLVLLLSLLPCLLLSGCADSSERAWQSGQKALAEEKYDVAITSFQKAGSFQDAERLLLYAQASQDLVTGKMPAGKFHTENMGLFSGEFSIFTVLRIEADNIMV